MALSYDIAVHRDGRRTRLKWHRARRNAGDPVFTGRRILEGMARGASVEVDLVVHADRGYAVLHDETLERETTGVGAVRQTPAAVLRQLHLKGADGTPLDDRVMLLEDLTALLAGSELHRDGLLQLDFKQDAAALDDIAVANFSEAVAPVAEHMILSSGDADAVTILSAAVPGMRVGYDPCYGEILSRLRQELDSLISQGR